MIPVPAWLTWVLFYLVGALFVIALYHFLRHLEHDYDESQRHRSR